MIPEEADDTRALDAVPAVPVRIGLAPTVTATVVPAPVPLPSLTAPDPAAPIDWPTYAAWRRTKCPALDQYPEPGGALAPAVLGLVGEIGEISTLLSDHYLDIFVEPRLRAKLINECGDVLFYATWALDGWGQSVLDADAHLDAGVEICVPEDVAVAQDMAQTLAAGPCPEGLCEVIAMTAMAAVISLAGHAGATADAFKKLWYHRVAPDFAAQADHVITVMALVNYILVLASSSVQEALVGNQAKLNARYPDGFRVGGGHRTGEGT